jgi:protein-S-isoprenylcysteine O-methyltransferase Ste14
MHPADERVRRRVSQAARSVTSRKQLAIESWRRFREFVPDLQQSWCALVSGGGVAFSLVLFLAVGRLVARALPLGALIAQGSFVAWGGLWMRGFWRRRADYRRRYGALAYRELFFRFLLPAMVGGLAALCFPLLVGGERLLPSVIAYAPAAYLAATAQLLELRGKEVFWNIDFRSFVYNVFPERRHLITTGIFHWLRHPVYSAFVRFVFALALIRNNLPAVVCAGFGAAAIWLLARAEEAELERLDPDYANYREHVPALFASRPVRFWRFLLTGREID